MSSRNRVDALALSPFMKDCSLRQIRFGYVNTPMMQNKGQITLNINKVLCRRKFEKRIYCIRITFKPI